MGSCVSKCKPKAKIKKPYDQDCSHVQDKLVISQAPSPTQPPTLRKLALCPSSPSSSNSFSCASKSNSSELTSSLSSSSSSCSSSILCSKDRSFSNEFLWSCAKENPRIIIGLDSVKDRRLHDAGKILDVRTKPNVAPVKQSNYIPENRLARSTTQKRARAGSPTLTRQKSFRVEPERTNSTTYSRNYLRSPCPSRRFNGENCGHMKSTLISTYSTKESKRSVNSARKENIRPASPSTSSRLISRDRGFLRNGERFGHQIGSKVDEFGIKEVRSDVLMDITMEDIDNPLIALDCFIFL